MTSGPRRVAIRCAWLTLLAGLLVLGATQLWFLCDDAFIAFRYVSNAHDGLGLVWNPPPFEPVEGYTSFAWVMLLWFTWSAFGIVPPDAANLWSIGFGLVQFALVAVALLRLRRPGGLAAPDAVAFLALAAVVSNRTFLQWLTSGLETSLFNAALLAWVLLAFHLRARRRAGVLWLWSSAAAVAALSRPDGLLLAFVTVGVVLGGLVPGPTRRAAVLRLAPLSLVAVHVCWRRWFYGEWLPNTYYAKVTGAWPEAGLRYFACFVIEHGSWVVLMFAIFWIAAELRRGWRVAWAHAVGCGPAVAAVVAVLMQCAYYTLVVGGDHFEYRVYSPLVPLSVLAVAAIAARMNLRARATAGLLLLLWAASGVGWLQAAAIADMPSQGFRALADHAPAWCAPLARWYDRQQAWLRARLIGVRCREHARFLEGIPQRHQPRRWLATAEQPFPVVALSSVGYLGWHLPDTIVIDALGLNDWVVARLPSAPPDPAPMRLFLRGLFASCDQNGDARLDASEMRVAVDRLSGGATAIDDIAKILTAGVPSQEPGVLTAKEFEDLAEVLFVVRRMAHEREAPKDYVVGLRPNVEFVGADVIVRARAEPLTAAEIRSFEAEWQRRAAAARQ
ncbi:MAG: hypothetical protein ABIP94_06650 [Planctomycetota bacterium]